MLAGLPKIKRFLDYIKIHNRSSPKVKKKKKEFSAASDLIHFFPMLHIFRILEM